MDVNPTNRSDTPSTPLTPSHEGRRALVSGAGRLGLGTALSRVLGLGRDMTRAYFFGTGPAADAFTIAFRLPNLLRALFAEGSLSAAFVPTFARELEKGDRRDHVRFLRACSGTLLAGLLGVTFLGILLAPIVVPLMVPGFAAVEGKIELTVQLTQALFPYLLLIGLATLAMGALNALRHFTAPALAPAVLNIVLIVGVLLLCPIMGDRPETQIWGLVIAVAIGGALQLAIQIPELRKRGLTLWPSLEFNHPGVHRVFTLMLPGVIGISVQEINAFVDIFLASFLEPGSPSALEYGQRVMQLPLGIVGVALGTAVLPTLSRQLARGERGAAEDTAGFSMRVGFLVLAPAAIGFVLLAEPILSLLFARGAFAEGRSLEMTTRALQFFAVGLPAYGAAKSLVPLFYAHGDTRTPVRCSILSMISNIALNLILMQYLGLGGLALATALSSFLNVGLLLYYARRRHGFSPLRHFRVALLRTAPALVGFGVVAAGSLMLIQRLGLGGVLGALVAGVVPLTAASLAYFAFLEWRSPEEWRYLRDLVRTKMRRAPHEDGGASA